MFVSVTLLWLFLIFWVNSGITTVAGSLLSGIELNITAFESRDKIFFSRQSENASFYLSFNDSDVHVRPDVNDWQELIFTNSTGIDCTSPLTLKKSTSSYVVEVCSEYEENEAVVRIVDAVNISWAIGVGPPEVIENAENKYGIQLIDPALCILAILILGILCYIVYLLHDTRKMMNARKEGGRRASLCTLQDEPQAIHERKFSTASLSVPPVFPNAVSNERKHSFVHIDSKPNSVKSIKPPSNLPPPVPLTPDRMNFQPSSAERLDSDSTIPLASNDPYEEEEHDYDYIDLQKLNSYKDQMTLVGKEIEAKFATLLRHDSENSLYEAVRPSESNAGKNSDTCAYHSSQNSLYESVKPQGSIACENSDTYAYHGSQNSLYETVKPLESNECGTSDTVARQGSQNSLKDTIKPLESNDCGTSDTIACRGSQNSLRETTRPLEPNGCETFDTVACRGSNSEISRQALPNNPETEEFGNAGTFTQLENEESPSVASNQDPSLLSDKKEDIIRYGSLLSVICKEGPFDAITTANQNQQQITDPDFESMDDYAV
ncbi:uncharacterized protein [Palaemon carinicauda]|uniref:uncharacterized protein n=1 Tax=Palaemon carinicauda TaxID=392227 RepID=UPI0035B5CD7F